MDTWNLHYSENVTAGKIVTVELQRKEDVL